MRPNPDLCPQDVIDSLRRYVNRGIPPGDFLEAVLENNLTEAFARADEFNLEALPHIVAFVYDKVPLVAWKSRENVLKWVAARTEAPIDII